MNAGIKAKDFFDRALFPVSVGAVVAEIVTMAAAVLKSGISSETVAWASVLAAAAAFLFQSGARKKQ